MSSRQHGNAPFIEYGLLLVLAALWGGSFTLIKIALESYPPMTIVAFRIFFGGLIVVQIALFRRVVFPSSAKRWGELLIQGILHSALPFFLITWAEKFVDSSLAGIINSTPPMFVFIITVFLLRTASFDVFKFLGIVLGMSGVALIATSQFNISSDSSTLAVIAVLMASASYASGAIFGQRFGDQSVFVTGGVSLLLASFLIGPAAIIFEQPFNLEPTMRATLALLALTLFSTALASLIFFRLIKTLGTLATTSNAYLRALFSILLGVMFLDEELSIFILAATGLIFLGVFFVTGQFRTHILKK